MDQMPYTPVQVAVVEGECRVNMISVVIPYFQRQPGLLSAALQSVASQTAFIRVDKVIVVDDGSPHPAQSEIDALGRDHKIQSKLELVLQPNGGVSRARNAGLARVDRQVEYVAFLDPDDIWLPEHLALSLEALDAGSDFHFSNFTHIGQKVGAFERAGYLVAAQHPELRAPALHWYQGDMVRQITTANVIGTTSVAYRFSCARNVRFVEGFAFAGEDYLMWLSLLPYCKKISFTAMVTANCGEGINLFSGAPWGSSHLCKRLLDEINYRTYLLESVPMAPDTASKVLDMLNENRSAYLNNMLSMLKRLKLSILPLVLSHVVTHRNLRRLLLKRL